MLVVIQTFKLWCPERKEGSVNHKMIIILVLTGLAVLFIIQNVTVVEIKFLLWSVQMSRSLLMFFLIAIGKHIHANMTFRKARRNIPISIGGWGTRGKSGTERLKAALIGVMGHGLVSKTTGCEAMFIHANPHGEPLEIPLWPTAWFGSVRTINLVTDSIPKRS